MLGMVAARALWVWKLPCRPDAERWNHLHFRLEAWWPSEGV
jgi:hypothetical protein